MTEAEELLGAVAPVLREFSEDIRKRLNGIDSYPSAMEAIGKSVASFEPRFRALEARAAVPGPAGEPGRDGKDAPAITQEQIAAAVLQYLQRHPPAAGPAGPVGATGKDGKPGVDGKDGRPGEAGIGLPGAAGKDGLAGAEGKEGPAGRDGRDGIPGPVGERGLDGLDGKDGLGMEDLDIKQGEDLRTLTFRWSNGTRVKERTLRFPFPIYRGVYEPGRKYQQGDTVTRAGAQWYANADTDQIPGDGQTSWTLCVKQGREGKKGEKGDRGISGKDGMPGRDLTQTESGGLKW